MLPTRPCPIRSAALPALLMCLLSLAGCGGNSDSVSGPKGDNAGENMVAFVTDRAKAAGDYTIRLYDIDQGGYRSIAGVDGAGSELDPCLSNDGNFLAFSAARPGGSTASDIYIYDRLNQAILASPGLNSARDETWPRFTYDSVHLAFVTKLASGETRVRLYEPLGDTLISLPGLDAPLGFDDDMPAPNVDGGRIAFVSNRAGTHDVLVWNRASGITTIDSLTSSGDDIEPSLSANGRWLAFASDRPGGKGAHDVYLYDLVADSLVTLPGINHQEDDRHPSVSADGDVIVFQSNRAGGGGQYDLYMYTHSTLTLEQPAAFRDASNDIQPYLRWR